MWIFIFYLFIWLCPDLAVVCRLLGCSMWTVVPWPGIKPTPPALEAWSFNRQGSPMKWILDNDIISLLVFISPTLVRKGVLSKVPARIHVTCRHTHTHNSNACSLPLLLVLGQASRIPTQGQQMYRLARDVTWPDRGTFGVNWGFLSCSPNIPLGPTFPWPPLLLWLRSVITVLRFLCVRLLKIVLLLPLALIISDKSENKLFFF